MLTQREQLKNRIEHKRKQLEARFAELKADSRAAAARERDYISKKLSELKSYLASGWNNLSETVSAKLNSWLDETEEKAKKEDYEDDDDG